MGFFKKKATSGEPGNYLSLRALALATKPDGKDSEPDRVYAAVVDIPLSENRLVTLFCSYDGTVSLYYNSGGGMLGLGERYEAVKAAGNALINGSSQLLGFLEKETDTTPRFNKNTTVFLLTGNGTYVAEYDINTIAKCENHIMLINLLIQNTLSSIRICTQGQ